MVDLAVWIPGGPWGELFRAGTGGRPEVPGQGGGRGREAASVRSSYNGFCFIEQGSRTISWQGR